MFSWYEWPRGSTRSGGVMNFFMSSEQHVVVGDAERVAEKG